MSKIPELMTSISGEKITTTEQWETFRRPEIMTLMSNFIYGVRPVERPDDLYFKIEREEKCYLGAALDYNRIKIGFSDYSFCVHSYFPQNITEPIPAFVFFLPEYQLGDLDFETQLKSINVDTEQITSRGYAIFILPNTEIYPDWENKCNHQAGIFSVLGPDENSRQDNSWASVSAWAWGGSRIMDYIETDNRIDKTKVTVVGHSRCGKTALWCGATDTRFACVISNMSGCAGAAMHRTKGGEHIKNINITDWFCNNYHKYNDREEFLPSDQHMLIAAIAPRLCYVSSASLDDWADPEAERLSCKMAGEAYALYEKEGIVLPEGELLVNTAYHEGTIGYHVREGEHEITVFDWSMFLDFVDKKLK